MRQVIIMRGFPGSGKSTWLKNSPGRKVICSADHHFTVPGTGEYHFNHSQLEEAHNACMCKFVWSVTEGHSIVVVDNTNLTINEILPYFQVAKAFGYDIKIVEMRCSIDLAKSRNVHNVPSFIYDKMKSKYQGIPYWMEKKVQYIKVYS